MEAKVIKVGTSVGLIIPRFIAVEGGFNNGASINIEYSQNRIVITKVNELRKGWAEAFAKYTKEGEDEMLLPDYLDKEAEELI